MYVQIVLLLSAAAVLVRGAAPSNATPWPCSHHCFTDDLLSKILYEHVGLGADFAHLTLACRCCWMPLGRAGVVQALFESPTTTSACDLRQLIRTVAVLVRHDPESRDLVRSVRPELVLGLYHRIRLMSAEVESDLLRTLLTRFHRSELDKEAKLYSEFRSGRFTLADLARIPLTLPNPDVTTANWWVVNADHRIRDALPELLPNIPESSDPLADPQVVLALRRYGLVFSFADYIDNVEIPPESVADIVPLMKIDSLSDVLRGLSYLIQRPGDRNRADDCSRALAVLRIPFIQQAIVDSFPSNGRWISSIMRLVPKELLPSLIELPFMSIIINVQYRDFYQRTEYDVEEIWCGMIDYAIKFRHFDIARMLMRIPTLSLYVEGAQNPAIDNIFVYLLRNRSRAKVLEFLESSEVVNLILQDIRNLIKSLTKFMKSRYVEQFRGLIQCSFYNKIPHSQKCELVEIAKAHDNQIYEILRTTTDDALHEQ